ncbi:MAG: DUF3459 domain-containing protein [Bryobacteraceae bacterium]
MAPGYKTRNVSAENGDPDSLLNFYKALIRLRRENRALRDGDFVLVNETDHNVLSYLRRAGDGAAVLVALNFSPKSQTARFTLESQGLHGKRASTLLSSFGKAGQPVDLNGVALPAYGSWVGQIR